jgi:hypothetical protein
MFVLQTTIGVLVAFMALTAYNKIQNALPRSRVWRKGVKLPWMPWRSTMRNISRHRVPTVRKGELRVTDDGHEDQKELETYKQLYHKLHNIERYPEILTECRELLISLLSACLSTALRNPKSESSILSVGTFSREGLGAFLKTQDAHVANCWEEYLVRRRGGLPREMFSDDSEAKWWLKQAAPVKYVDGAWLGHINKASTPFNLRKITKNAWQVMSEELGDGDVDKNHVRVYENLMQDIGAGLPAADSVDFISPRHGMDSLRCWKAAVAQLLISLFPHDFLPEVLGFNMAYETLPLHLLKTVTELRELKLNPYYFELHISIDNADSGHAAMAAGAVESYLNLIAERDGAEAAAVAWRRVQAGYVLADGLPTTAETPSAKTNKTVQLQPSWNDNEAALLEIFAAKAPVAHKIHCSSRLRIGRHTLVDWLEPDAFKHEHWQKDFLHDLSLCRPWVIQGHSERSRLVRELSWEGKMFGSFTQSEVEIVKAWIDSLGGGAERTRPDSDVYHRFVRLSSGPISGADEDNILVGYPCFAPMIEPAAWLAQPSSDVSDSPPLRIDGRGAPNIRQLIPIWFASTALLESLPSLPARAADTVGSAVIRVLRAQAGFSAEGPGVAGMDEVRRTNDGQSLGIIELGVEICDRAGLGKPGTLQEAVQFGGDEGKQTAERMVSMGMRWLAYREVLVGMSWAFMELHEQVAERGGPESLLGPESRQVLAEVARRERQGLEVCKTELEHDREKAVQFWRGVMTARRAIERCFPA